MNVNKRSLDIIIIIIIIINLLFIYVVFQPGIFIGENWRCTIDQNITVVCFLLSNSPASEFYMPTFRNTLFRLHTYLPMKMERTECSETSAYKIQTPGNYPEESIQHSEQGESLK